MYYKRLISKTLESALLEENKLKWLYSFVKQRDDLDFLIGARKSTEWISIYRGLSKIIQISRTGNKFTITGDKRFKDIAEREHLDIYSQKNSTLISFRDHLSDLIDFISKDAKFDRYYENKKEGFYQNKLSRKYGIDSLSSAEFVIIDKEVVIGYENKAEKTNILGGFQKPYKELLNNISLKNPERYGRNLSKKHVGNELDFLAWKNDGTLLLIEYKHGTNTSGIYLSPLQIGLYTDIFKHYQRKQDDFSKTLKEMVAQKQRLGLINSNWQVPQIIKTIKPILLISEYNPKSSGMQIFREILDICREKFGSSFLDNLEVLKYDCESDEITNVDINPSRHP